MVDLGGGGLKFTLNLFNTFANLLTDCHEERINQSSERYTIRYFSQQIMSYSPKVVHQNMIRNVFSDTLVL